MIKLTLASHADVLSKSGTKFHIAAPGGKVYGTMVVSGAIAYLCITDEGDEAIEASDGRLSNSTAVQGFEIV